MTKLTQKLTKSTTIYFDETHSLFKL